MTKEQIEIVKRALHGEYAAWASGSKRDEVRAAERDKVGEALKAFEALVEEADNA